MMVRLEDVLLVLWLAGWAVVAFELRHSTRIPPGVLGVLLLALWPLWWAVGCIIEYRERRPWRD